VGLREAELSTQLEEFVLKRFRTTEKSFVLGEQFHSNLWVKQTWIERLCQFIADSINGSYQILETTKVFERLLVGLGRKDLGKT
jgi:hypothetical protein